MNRPHPRRSAALLVAAPALLAGSAVAVLGTCGPFLDVAADAFCPFVLEIFYLGITTGTTPTTYDPVSSVTRLQMAAFLSRTVDSALKRGSRRAALDQFWTPQNESVLGLTTLSQKPHSVAFDGADVWAAGGNSVWRVRASDGRLLETWTGGAAAAVFGVLVATGRVLVSGSTTPSGRLYEIDPKGPAGLVTTVASNFGAFASGIAFDGARVWTANNGDPVGTGSVSIITPGSTIPWTTTTITTGFNAPARALFDRTNIWVTDYVVGTLLKLDGAGAILQTVTLGTQPFFPLFDGTNIWGPNGSANSVTNVRASSGAVLQTLTGNGLGNPIGAAFDGERVLVTNFATDMVFLWKAANLAPIGSFSTGPVSSPYGVCSDGANFWVALYNKSQLARF